jgi:predicted nucleic acid-binding protein
LIAFDTSALVKRVIDEPGWEAVDELMEDLYRRGQHLIMSTLASVEVSRTIRARHQSSDPRSWGDLTAIALSGISEIPIESSVTSLARRIGPTTLRSLDAIHLATALVTNADCFITYDRQLASAAEDLGMPTLAPQ